MITAFYFSVSVFAFGWTVYLLHAAATGKAVSNRNVALSQRTLIVQALAVGWVGLMSATAVFDALAQRLPLRTGLVVLTLLIAGFMISLAVDARRPVPPSE